MSQKLRFKRGMKAGLPTLAEGEPGWVTDERKLYVGTGSENIPLACDVDLAAFKQYMEASLSTKANDLGRLTQEIFDDATYPHPYFGTTIDLAGQPSTGQYRMIYIPYFANVEGYAVQVAVGAVTNAGLHWRKSHGTTWLEWEDAATATPPEEHPLPLAEGYVVAYGQACDYSVAQDKLVVVHVSVARQDGANLNGVLTLATLPAGVRPAKAVVSAAAFGVYLKADTNGAITCHAPGTYDSIGGTLVFYAAA